MFYEKKVIIKINAKKVKTQMSLNLAFYVIPSTPSILKA